MGNSNLLLMVFGVVFTFIVLIILTLNVEELVKKYGLDQFLSKLGDAPLVSEIKKLGHYKLWLAAAFFVGGTAALWINAYMPKDEIIRPNIPTSVRLQFTSGSSQVALLADENVRYFHAERIEYTLRGEGGKYLGQKVIWFVVLTFAKPTSYSQIIVDAGNARIPEYQVTSQKYYSAIVRFAGDIGNVALVIKCIPFNPE